MSSGNADELPGGASDSTEQSKARRFLVGIPTFWVALTLGVLGERVKDPGPLGLAFAALPLVLIIGGLLLQRSRPKGSEKTLTPRNLRRIAHLAEVPELGTMIMVYGCAIVGMTTATLSLVALYRSPH